MPDTSIIDTSLPEGFINSAKILCPKDSSNEPEQADLRGAVSMAYYAVFHALARECANSLVGDDKSNQSNENWVDVCRGLSHTNIKNICKISSNVKNAYKNKNTLEIEFLEEIKDFADAFNSLQSARNKADYNPKIELNKSAVIEYIETAEGAIGKIKDIDKDHKVTFAIRLSFNRRRN